MMQGMLDLMQKGGPAMWAILVVSVVGVAVFLERLVYLHRAQIRVGEFLRGLANLVRGDRYEEARKQCLSTPGPVARVALSAVLARDCPRSELRDIVQEAGQLEVPRLERHLPLLAGLAYTAPLLGLLGTVLGLLEAFYLVSTQGGYATVADVSGAAYQSLISAAAGLAVTLGFAPLAAADPGSDDTLMPCEVVGGSNECEGNNSELVDIPSNLGVIGPQESEPVWGMIGW